MRISKFCWSLHKRRKISSCKIHDEVSLCNAIFVWKTEISELVIARLVGIRFYEWKADWIVFDYFRFWCLIVMRIYVLMILQIHFMSCDLLIFTSTCKVFLKTEHWISGTNTIKRRVDADIKAKGDIPLAMMNTKHQLDT